MSKAMQTLRLPKVTRDGDGEVEQNLPVGEGGTWDFVHAIHEGSEACIVVAAQTDLRAAAEALMIVVRAMELAGTLGTMPDGRLLAAAAMQAMEKEAAEERLIHGGHEDCETKPEQVLGDLVTADEVTKPEPKATVTWF